MLPVQLWSILMVKTAWKGSLVAPLEAAELCPFLRTERMKLGTPAQRAVPKHRSVSHLCSGLNEKYQPAKACTMLLPFLIVVRVAMSWAAPTASFSGYKPVGEPPCSLTNHSFLDSRSCHPPCVPCQQVWQGSCPSEITTSEQPSLRSFLLDRHSNGGGRGVLLAPGISTSTTALIASSDPHPELQCS